MGVSGIFLPEDGYLEQLRQLTQERGILLIFDEVLTGFRLALGGSQEYFGVVPDLACYAKAMSGGIPIAALAGRREPMGVLGRGTSGASMFGGGAKAVCQSGTMNDNTPGTAAAIASIKVLKRLSAEGEYGRLNARTSRLASAIRDIFRHRGIPCQVNIVGSFFRIHFTDEDPTFDTVCRIDKRLIYLFAVALMAEGVLLCAPSSGSSFLSFAHTDEDVAKILEAVNVTLDKFDFAEVL
jgi:glutamate-1-semialdehyde 2,1-aminomutase